MIETARAQLHCATQVTLRTDSGKRPCRSSFPFAVLDGGKTLALLPTKKTCLKIPTATLQFVLEISINELIRLH